MPIIQTYRLLRNLKTVHEVWSEYKTHVKTIEATQGAAWRREPSERKFFSRRKRIYNAIERLINNGMEENAAVTAMENRKLRENWSLDKIQKNI